MSEQIVKRRPMIDLEEFERRLRQPLAASSRDDDPLAELARGFAGNDADPYRTVFEPLSRRPAAAWQNEPDQGEAKSQGARVPLIEGDFAAIEAGLLGTAKRDRQDHESLIGTGDFESYPQEAHEPWPYAEAEASREAEPAYEEVRSRRPLYVMAAMILAGLAGIGASFGFKGAVSNSGEIATIQAAEGPAKIHPETVASTDVQDHDATVLGGAPQQPPVAAVNTAEQPADLSAQMDTAAQAAVTGGASGAASVPVPPPPAHVQAQPQPAPEPVSIANLIEPKKVKTVSVRPDGSLVPGDAPAHAAAPPAAHAAAPAGASPAKPAAPKSAARAAAQKPPATKANGTQVADARGQQVPAAVSAASSGSFSVQLAAPTTEVEAREAQARIMRKFGNELAGFHPTIHKAEVGGKPVYRVRVSGLNSRDEAAALCQKVQSGGGNCFVAKN